MTSFAIAINAPASTDRGLSDEALSVYESVRWALDYSNTYSIGKPKADLFTAVQSAAEEGRAENWDSEGAAAVEPSAVRYALDFASSIPLDFPLPEVFPDRDGDICFEWYYGPRKVFTVCVARDGTLTFAGLFGHSTKIHGSTTLGEIIPTAILEGIETAAA